MMLRGDAPNVRRIAISPRFSRTTMTSVDTMLNAATATTIDNRMNMIDFVSAIERNTLACWRLQSLI
jgi:hypothetical protein